MAAKAQTTLRAYTSPHTQVLRSEYNGSDPKFGALRAIVESPENDGNLRDFLKALAQLDPSLARSDDLTAALCAAVSTPNYDAWKADVFAQQSLKFEFTAALASAKDQIDFPATTISLFSALLQHRRIRCLLLEDVLISLRKSLLAFAQTGNPARSDQIQLAEAMALHSFHNDYIWDETSTEKDDVAKLVSKVSDQIAAGTALSAFELFLIGAYRSLFDINAVRTWVATLSRRDLSALDPTLRQLVFDRLIEDATSIDAITPVTCKTSKDVQSQYQENPYPRWRYMPARTPLNTVETYVAAGIGQHMTGSGIKAAQAKVLIAGGGTGAHPISVAQSLPNAAVLAIDLSRPSLAYADREATVRGVKNIAFAQGDILKLCDVDAEFDLIESVGVLHHMKDPEAGLRALLKVLKPGGYLRLALYSKMARHAVNAARTRFGDGAYAPGLAGIRAFRRDLRRTNDPSLAPLQTLPDFFAASEFRDLVMHVQEHQFTLPQIDGLLRRNGLKFLGFASGSARAVLRKMPAQRAQKRRRDLSAWDKHEKSNPDAFIGMYDFFCMKR